MILLISVILGLAAGFIRSRLTGRNYQVVDIRAVGLVFLAYLPQFFAFFLPATQSRISDGWIPIIQIGSQAILLIFAWLNRRLPGFWLLLLGLLANFTVIVLNGGMMPLLPQIARELVLPRTEIMLIEGQRIGFGKDILLSMKDTRLWFLGDIFLLPSFFNYPLAFSFGDILIGTGAFWLLWQLGGPRRLNQEVSS